MLCLQRRLPRGAAGGGGRAHPRAGSRCDGLAALDQLHDLIRFPAQVSVRPEGVVPAAVSAATSEDRL